MVDADIQDDRDAEPKPLGIRETQRAAKREIILKAAISLFSGRGFEGASLPAISQESGVPVPLIVYHFRNKELLWQAAVDEIYRRIEEHVGRYEAEISEATGPEYYRAHIRAHITAIAAHPEYMRILFQEGTQTSDRLIWLADRHQNQMTKLLTDLIERAQSEGWMPSVNPVHAKFIFSGAFVLPFVLAAEYRIVSNEDPLDPAFVDRHIDTCLRFLLPALVEN